MKGNIKKRNGEIDLLKFIFCVIIMILHSKNFVVEESEKIFLGGAVGVSFFFIVSGYLMTKSAMEKNVNITESVAPATIDFLWKKIKSFMPNIYVAWFFAFIVEAFIVDGATFYEAVKKCCYSIWELLFLSMSGLMGGDAYRANSVTWYLSAMLLVMSIFYPIILKKRKNFLLLIAPLVSIFIYGYVFSNFKAGFSPPSAYVGIIRKGLLRAFAEIALGCACYIPAQKIRSLRTTKFFDTILTVVGSGCYGVVIWLALDSLTTMQCLISGLLLAIAITISFSEKTLWNIILDNKIITWLGIISFDIYICHGFWSHALKKLMPDYSYKYRFIVYVCLVVVTVIAVRVISNGIRRMTPKIKKYFYKKMFYLVN